MTKIKHNDGRSLEDELRFFHKIQGMGFVLRGDSIAEESNGAMGWTRNDFEVDITYSKPKVKNRFDNSKRPVRRSLTVYTHPGLGINLSVSSTPFNQKYHFATQRPLRSEEKAITHLTNYLEATVQDKKYSS